MPEPPNVELADAVDEIAAAGAFSGVVRVDRPDAPSFARAYGFAHRAFEIENRIDTQFGIASGGKGLTALAVVRLVEAGSLDLEHDRPFRAGRRPAAHRGRCDG